ncbi:MAG: methionine biosynthesis protein MetW [Rhodospirillaceae bacterium]|nr:methionine biosynthesis protein MetW [Rhodospirillaceae bacterium]|tara:strand:+ start:6910 stop:7539 length:630 start_codon:yes stop_codon:yes gene_type:complete
MKTKTDSSSSIRGDFRLIADIVQPGSRVLDIGCSDGTLLELLEKEKNVDGKGIEISPEGVNASVRRGLSVIQGDANTDLYDYPSDAFDYVILGQTLPAIHHPREILLELLRIGTHAIVSIPNAGYWRYRLHLLIQGRIPIQESDDTTWWSTANIHPCTIRDFVNLCKKDGHLILSGFQINSRGRAVKFLGTGSLANLFGAQAIFLLSRK